MGLYQRILGHPFVYNHIRPLVVGGIETSRLYARLRADHASVILDVGCGTGDALRHLQEYESYLGVDTDPIALDFARKNHGHKPCTRFEARLLEEKDVEELAPTHVILAGLLHHLTDEQATGLLQMLCRSPRLQRIVTQDIVFLPDAFLNNFFAILDRGQYCRNASGYTRLLGGLPLKVIESEAMLSHPDNPLGVRYWVMTLEPSSP